jgi:hypothetical protein
MTQFHIEIEIRDENGKLFPHPRGHGNFTGFKFIQEYRDYDAMGALFKLMHEELKMLMPKNQFNINAYSHNSISGTYMLMAFYDEEMGFKTQ